MTTSNSPMAQLPIELQYNQTILICPLDGSWIMIPVKGLCKILNLDFDERMAYLKNDRAVGQYMKEIELVGESNALEPVPCIHIFDAITFVHCINLDGLYPDRILEQVELVEWLKSTINTYYAEVAVMDQTGKRQELILAVIEELEADLEENPADGPIIYPKIKALLDEYKMLDDKILSIRPPLYTNPN